MRTFSPQVRSHYLLRGDTPQTSYINSKGEVTNLLYYNHVDTPTMCYPEWLSRIKGGLANLKDAQMKVAIIGAGVSGITIGFEFLRAGFTNFEIFEASNRIGGRFDSYKFPNDSKNFAELGAMRFPPSEGCLYYYIQYLQEQYKIGKQPHKIVLSKDFPDPGLVPTLVAFKDESYITSMGKNIPPNVEKIATSWEDFVNRKSPIVLGDGELLPAPKNIMNWLDKSNPDTFDPVRARNAWQIYVNKFKDKTYVEGIIDIFCQPNAPGGVAWNYPEDVETFGAVGTGIGGSAPLFEISFVDMMRFTLDKLEEDHAQIVTGVDSVTNAMIDCEIDVDGKLHRVRDYIKLNSPVGEVNPENDGKKITLVQQNSQEILGKEYTHIVVAMTHRAAEIGLKIDSKWHNPTRFSSQSKNAFNEEIINMESREAITNLHIAQSSKFFIKVKPWWKEDDTRVRCITTDTAMANFYTLDYDDKDNEAVCLLNYVWEDWSEKSEALGSINERYQRFLHDLKMIAPDYILECMPEEANEKNAVMIDWQEEKNYYGAFMLTYPFQEDMLSTLFYNFKEKRPNGVAQIYFTGDSYHWIGGWCEGAFQTALNAFCAITKSVNKTITYIKNCPYEKLNTHLINYKNESNNGAVTSFGPIGGTGGNIPFEIAIDLQDIELYYTNSKEPIINGLKVGNELYGTRENRIVKIPNEELKNVTTMAVYVCSIGSIFSETGRVRCLEVNGKLYGPKPTSKDAVYKIKTSGKATKVVKVIGVSGHDIDRIGFTLVDKKLNGIRRVRKRAITQKELV